MTTQIGHEASTTITRAGSAVSHRQVAGMLLMAAGWGWISGNFVQPAVPFFYGGIEDSLHVLPLLTLLLLSLRWFQVTTRISETGARAGGSRLGITLVALFSILACAVFVVLGASNPDPNSVDVHTLEDAMPVIVLVGGALLWLTTLVSTRRQA